MTSAGTCAVAAVGVVLGSSLFAPAAGAQMGAAANSRARVPAAAAAVDISDDRYVLVGTKLCCITILSIFLAAPSSFVMEKF